MRTTCDFVVIGGGIAGVAVAHELAAQGSVLLADMESHLAYHTTGRSAAISMESYGNATIRALTKVSSRFLRAPDETFSPVPLAGPRGALILADAEMQTKLEARFSEVRKLVPDATLLRADDCLELVPYLARNRWVGGLYEPSAFDLDVHAIHGAYLAGLRRRGGIVVPACRLTTAERRHGDWRLLFSDGRRVVTPTVVNAAGAWADEVARLVGAEPVGLRPLRRTVALVTPSVDVSHMPYVGTVDEQIFIKPESGGLMVSPCDETPSEPCDSWADDLDVAIAIDRLERAMTLTVGRPKASWAGLRSFLPDRSPVVGPDPATPGFAWYAGVGGYGIQTVPALSSLTAALIVGSAVSPELEALGFDVDSVRVERCRTRTFEAHPVECVAELG